MNRVPAVPSADNPSRRSLIAAFGGSMFLLTGCSSSTNANSSSGGAAPATSTATSAATSTSTSGVSPTGSGANASSSAMAGMITIQNFAFAPASLTVAAGSTITVTNKDSVTHTVTASDAQKSFDTGDIAGGSTVTFKAPAKAGTYAYSCTIHPYMHGTLTVQ